MPVALGSGAEMRRIDLQAGALRERASETNTPMSIRWTPLLLVGMALACGSRPPAAETGPPPTDRDPLPFAPQPGGSGETGTPVGLSASGGKEQARTVALRFIEAIRDGDERTLTRLLGARLALAQPRLSEPNRARTQVIEQALDNPRRQGLGPDVPLERLVDTEGLSAAALRDVPRGGRGIPRGLEPADIHVSLPLQPEGRRVLRFLLPGWVHRGVVIVRTGLEPHVVAL